MVGVLDPIGYGGYGTAYVGGARTLAAACFLALTRAEEFLDAAGIGIPDIQNT